MKNVEENIRKRRSVRTFNGEAITDNEKKLLSDVEYIASYRII